MAHTLTLLMKEKKVVNMKTYKAEINISYMRKAIDENYFSSKDILFKLLLLGLYRIYTNTTDVFNMPNNIVIDDSRYNHIFTDLIKYRNAEFKEVVNFLNVSEHIQLYLDISIYLDIFLEQHQTDKCLNVYNIDIADSYMLIITNKHMNINSYGHVYHY